MLDGKSGQIVLNNSVLGKAIINEINLSTWFRNNYLHLHRT